MLGIDRRVPPACTGQPADQSQIVQPGQGAAHAVRGAREFVGELPGRGGLTAEKDAVDGLVEGVDADGCELIGHAGILAHVCQRQQWAVVNRCAESGSPDTNSPMGHHIRHTGRSVRRPLHAALTAAVLGGLLGGAPVARAADAPARTRVIVELDGATALEAPAGAARDARTADVRSARERIDARQDTVLDAAQDAGAAPKSVRHLGLALNAVAMTVDEDSVTRLRALPGVKAVVPDTRMKVLATDAHELVGIPDVWKRPAPGGGTATGKGVTVAVVDSGVDYTHPDLGAGLGEGHKVVGGHDFVNDDDDPMDDNAHGTHVAGIIAAKSAAPGGITGAAPDARLLAYKVMDADGYGETSAIIAGIEAAIDPANPHRADVINLSIGGPGDGTDPLGLAATAAVDAGVVVVAAAGTRDRARTPSAVPPPRAASSPSAPPRAASPYPNSAWQDSGRPWRPTADSSPRTRRRSRRPAHWSTSAPAPRGLGARRRRPRKGRPVRLPARPG